MQGRLLRTGSARSLQDGGKDGTRGGSGAIYKVAVTTGDKKNGGTDARVRWDLHHPLVRFYIFILHYLPFLDPGNIHNVKEVHKWLENTNLDFHTNVHIGENN